MPSWNNLSAPGYDQIGTSIKGLNDDATTFNNSDIISGKQHQQFADFSGSFDTHFSATQLSKTYASHGPFDLGLGLADPRLQSTTQHLGGFDPNHSGRAANLTTATYEHPSLSIRPTLTVLPTTDGSRFRKLFQQKMAAEAGRQMSGQTPSSDQSHATAQPESGSGGSRNPSWKSRSAAPPNGSGNNLLVNTAHAEGLAGYRAKGDLAQDDLPRPKTSDGVIFVKDGETRSVPPGERHPVSADATIPIPLPSWQPPMASGVAGYRPQPQQSAYYQRMLAAKLGAASEDSLAAKAEENSYMPPSISQTDMAFMPSSYSPMYQMFSNGGGLDPHYQAQHTPQGQNQQPAWNNQAAQAYGPGPNDPSYLGLFKNQSSDNAAPFANNYSSGQQQQAPPGWNSYYAPNGPDARNPAGGPGPAQQQQHQGGQGQWNRNGAKAEEIAPPAVEDWMAAWPHIKNPGHDSGKPAASTSSTRKKVETEPRAKKEGSVADSGKGGDQPKKAALACHFCRGRKLKCDAVRPICAHCAKRSLNCSYDVEIRRRGPGKRKKELLAQQHARANGEPYHSEDDLALSRKRKSGHGDQTDREEDSQSESVGLHSGIDMSVQPSSSGMDQYSQQAYSAHSMSAAPYSGGSHYGSEQYHHYNNQMYYPPPIDAYHNSGYMPPYHPQYEAVSNDRSRPVPQGYDQVGGGQSYGHGYSTDRPGGPDEHQNKRVKLEG